MAHDPRLTSPSAARNIGPITEVLGRFLPGNGTVLEVASGPGQHISEWARIFPALLWQPSDIDTAALASIRAYRADLGLANLLPPLELDLMSESWGQSGDVSRTTAAKTLGQGGGGESEVSPEGHCCATAGASGLAGVIGVNILHISPWSASVGLLRGCGRRLAPHGHLFVYGPFKRSGRHTAASNAQFDATLRSRNAQWGIRDLEELEAAGAAHGLTLREQCEVPSNNLVLVFQRI